MAVVMAKIWAKMAFRGWLAGAAVRLYWSVVRAPEDKGETLSQKVRRNKGRAKRNGA